MNVGGPWKLIIFMYMYNSAVPCMGYLIVPAQFKTVSQSNYNTELERGLINKAECIIQKVLNLCMCAGKWAHCIESQAKDKS